MAKIAILTSTSPLRKTSSRFGVTKQRLDTEVALQLADQFDLVLVGSVASDEVFDHIARHLPRSVRLKFRFYGRGFFMNQATRKDEEDVRNVGWEAILAENRIEFEPFIKSGRSNDMVKFSWRRIEEFVTDRNVTFVTGGEGQLLFNRPAKYA